MPAYFLLNKSQHGFRRIIRKPFHSFILKNSLDRRTIKRYIIPN